MDNWQTFSERLFRDEDADPMYYALNRADLDTDTKLRFFVAWCTYYHPGVAADAAQYTGIRFWTTLRSVYTVAPRASERRHFRGKAGLLALDEWQGRYPEPERMIDSNFGDTFFKVRENLRHVRLFGDYFYWKFADVQERVFQVPCDFTNAENCAPKVPQEGAKMIALESNMTMTEPKQYVPAVFGLIIQHMAQRPVPPAYDRPFNMQEAETVCCVYHQYRGGSYTYGSRTAKAFRRLSAYPNRVSDALIQALTLSLPYTPPEGEES